MLILRVFLFLCGAVLIAESLRESKTPDGSIIEKQVYAFLYGTAAFLMVAGIFLPFICQGFTQSLIVRIFSILAAVVLLLILGTALLIILCPLFVDRANRAETAMLVLGAPVVRDTPTAVLQSRGKKAAEFFKDHPDMLCVLSGGKGGTKTEAETLADQMADWGVAHSALILENRATTTDENFLYAKSIFEEKKGRSFEDSLVVVTNDFHIFRLRYYARQAGYGSLHFAIAPTPSSVRLLWYGREIVMTFRHWFYETRKHK